MLTLLSLGLSDASGARDTTTLRFKIDGLTLADIEAFAQEYARRIDTITGARIDSISLALEVSLPESLDINPGAHSNVNEGANFTFHMQGVGAKDTIRIPALVNANFIGRESVDITAQHIITFLSFMIFPHIGSESGTNFSVVNSFGIPYVGLYRARRSWHTK